MKVIVTITLEDNTTPANLAEVGLTEKFLEVATAEAFKQLIDKHMSEGLKYEIEATAIDNTQEAEEVAGDE